MRANLSRRTFSASEEKAEPLEDPYIWPSRTYQQIADDHIVYATKLSYHRVNNLNAQLFLRLAREDWWELFMVLVAVADDLKELREIRTNMGETLGMQIPDDSELEDPIDKKKPTLSAQFGRIPSTSDREGRAALVGLTRTGGRRNRRYLKDLHERKIPLCLMALLFRSFLVNPRRTTQLPMIKPLDEKSEDILMPDFLFHDLMEMEFGSVEAFIQCQTPLVELTWPLSITQDQPLDFGQNQTDNSRAVVTIDGNDRQNIKKENSDEILRAKTAVEVKRTALPGVVRAHYESDFPIDSFAHIWYVKKECAESLEIPHVRCARKTINSIRLWPSNLAPQGGTLRVDEDEPKKSVAHTEEDLAALPLQDPYQQDFLSKAGTTMWKFVPSVLKRSDGKFIFSTAGEERDDELHMLGPDGLQTISADTVYGRQSEYGGGRETLYGRQLEYGGVRQSEYGGERQSEHGSGQQTEHGGGIRQSEYSGNRMTEHGPSTEYGRGKTQQRVRASVGEDVGPGSTGLHATQHDQFVRRFGKSAATAYRMSYPQQLIAADKFFLAPFDYRPLCSVRSQFIEDSRSQAAGIAKGQSPIGAPQNSRIKGPFRWHGKKGTLLPWMPLEERLKKGEEGYWAKDGRWMYGLNPGTQLKKRQEVAEEKNAIAELDSPKLDSANDAPPPSEGTANQDGMALANTHVTDDTGLPISSRQEMEGIGAAPLEKTENAATPLEKAEGTEQGGSAVPQTTEEMRRTWDKTATAACAEPQLPRSSTGLYETLLSVGAMEKDDESRACVVEPLQFQSGISFAAQTDASFSSLVDVLLQGQTYAAPSSQEKSDGDGQTVVVSGTDAAMKTDAVPGTKADGDVATPEAVVERNDQMSKNPKSRQGEDKEKEQDDDEKEEQVDKRDGKSSKKNDQKEKKGEKGARKDEPDTTADAQKEVSDGSQPAEADVGSPPAAEVEVKEGSEETMETKEVTQDQKEEAQDQKEEAQDQKEEAQDQKEETRDQKEETRDQKEEMQDQKEEAQDQKEETQDQKEETQDQKEETRDQKEETIGEHEETKDRNQETETKEVKEEAKKEQLPAGLQDETSASAKQEDEKLRKESSKEKKESLDGKTDPSSAEGEAPKTAKETAQPAAEDPKKSTDQTTEAPKRAGTGDPTESPKGTPTEQQAEIKKEVSNEKPAEAPRKTPTEFKDAPKDDAAKGSGKPKESEEPKETDSPKGSEAQKEGTEAETSKKESDAEAPRDTQAAKEASTADGKEVDASKEHQETDASKEKEGTDAFKEAEALKEPEAPKETETEKQKEGHHESQNNECRKDRGLKNPKDGAPLGDPEVIEEYFHAKRGDIYPEYANIKDDQLTEVQRIKGYHSSTAELYAGTHYMSLVQVFRKAHCRLPRISGVNDFYIENVRHLYRNPLAPPDNPEAVFPESLFLDDGPSVEYRVPKTQLLSESLTRRVITDDLGRKKAERSDSKSDIESEFSANPVDKNVANNVVGAVGAKRIRTITSSSDIETYEANTKKVQLQGQYAWQFISDDTAGLLDYSNLPQADMDRIISKREMWLTAHRPVETSFNDLATDEVKEFERRQKTCAIPFRRNLGVFEMLLERVRASNVDYQIGMNKSRPSLVEFYKKKCEEEELFPTLVNANTNVVVNKDDQTSEESKSHKLGITRPAGRGRKSVVDPNKKRTIKQNLKAASKAFSLAAKQHGTRVKELVEVAAPWINRRAQRINSICMTLVCHLCDASENWLDYFQLVGAINKTSDCALMRKKIVELARSSEKLFRNLDFGNTDMRREIWVLADRLQIMARKARATRKHLLKQKLMAGVMLAYQRGHHKLLSKTLTDLKELGSRDEVQAKSMVSHYAALERKLKGVSKYSGHQHMMQVYEMGKRRNLVLKELLISLKYHSAKEPFLELIKSQSDKAQSTLTKLLFGAERVERKWDEAVAGKLDMEQEKLQVDSQTTRLWQEKLRRAKLEPYQSPKKSSRYALEMVKRSVLEPQDAWKLAQTGEPEISPRARELADGTGRYYLKGTEAADGKYTGELRRKEIEVLHKVRNIMGGSNWSFHAEDRRPPMRKRKPKRGDRSTSPTAIEKDMESGKEAGPSSAGSDNKNGKKDSQESKDCQNSGFLDGRKRGGLYGLYQSKMNAVRTRREKNEAGRLKRNLRDEEKLRVTLQGRCRSPMPHTRNYAGLFSEYRDPAVSYYDDEHIELKTPNLERHFTQQLLVEEPSPAEKKILKKIATAELQKPAEEARKSQKSAGDLAKSEKSAADLGKSTKSTADLGTKSTTGNCGLTKSKKSGEKLTEALVASTQSFKTADGAEGEEEGEFLSTQSSNSSDFDYEGRQAREWKRAYRKKRVRARSWHGNFSDYKDDVIPYLKARMKGQKSKYIGFGLLPKKWRQPLTQEQYKKLRLDYKRQKRMQRVLRPYSSHSPGAPHSITEKRYIKIGTELYNKQTEMSQQRSEYGESIRDALHDAKYRSFDRPRFMPTGQVPVTLTGNHSLFKHYKPFRITPPNTQVEFKAKVPDLPSDAAKVHRISRKPAMPKKLRQPKKRYNATTTDSSASRAVSASSPSRGATPGAMVASAKSGARKSQGAGSQGGPDDLLITRRSGRQSDTGVQSGSVKVRISQLDAETHTTEGRERSQTLGSVALLKSDAEFAVAKDYAFLSQPLKGSTPFFSKSLQAISGNILTASRSWSPPPAEMIRFHQKTNDGTFMQYMDDSRYYETMLSMRRRKHRFIGEVPRTASSTSRSRSRSPSVKATATPMTRKKKGRVQLSPLVVGRTQLRHQHERFITDTFSEYRSDENFYYDQLTAIGKVAFTKRNEEIKKSRKLAEQRLVPNGNPLPKVDQPEHSDPAQEAEADSMARALEELLVANTTEDGTKDGSATAFTISADSDGQTYSPNRAPDGRILPRQTAPAGAIRGSVTFDESVRQRPPRSSLHSPKQVVPAALTDTQRVGMDSPRSWPANIFAVENPPKEKFRTPESQSTSPKARASWVPGGSQKKKQSQHRIPAHLLGSKAAARQSNTGAVNITANTTEDTQQNAGTRMKIPPAVPKKGTLQWYQDKTDDKIMLPNVIPSVPAYRKPATPTPRRAKQQRARQGDEADYSSSGSDLNGDDDGKKLLAIDKKENWQYTAGVKSNIDKFVSLQKPFVRTKYTPKRKPPKTEPEESSDGNESVDEAGEGSAMDGSANEESAKEGSSKDGTMGKAKAKTSKSNTEQNPDLPKSITEPASPIGATEADSKEPASSKDLGASRVRSWSLKGNDRLLGEEGSGSKGTRRFTGDSVPSEGRASSNPAKDS